MNFEWPQIIWLSCTFLQLLFVAVVHGKDLHGKHSFPVTFMICLFIAWLLWCGGFFDGR